VPSFRDNSEVFSAFLSWPRPVPSKLRYKRMPSKFFSRPVRINSPDITVAPSSIQGLGVFANRTFRRGETIERCPYRIVNRNHVTGNIVNYLYAGTTREIYLIAFGYAMLYNHSIKANLTHYFGTQNDIVFVARRTIRAGEELTLDYGPECAFSNS
jgi:uncharacterized protein